MTEKELINNLKELKGIKPRKDWVVLTKSRILVKEPSYQSLDASVFSVFRYKLALAPLLGVFLVLGLFGFAQSTIPGDLLFSIKKITETVQVGMSSTADKPMIQLQLANRRLTELSLMAERNQTESLAAAIQEFQSSISGAVKDIALMEKEITNPKALMELVEETKKISENKEKVETVLGTKINGTKELEDAIGTIEKKTAEFLIVDLENRTLSEESQGLLDEAKQDFEEEDYQEALYKLWQIYNH
jgi:hypothetical protein